MHHGGFNDIGQQELEAELDGLDDDLPLGVVYDCESLPLYDIPSREGEQLCALENGDEVEVIMDLRTSSYYAVRTLSGIEGYCSRRFIFL